MLKFLDGLFRRQLTLTKIVTENACWSVDTIILAVRQRSYDCTSKVDLHDLLFAFFRLSQDSHLGLTIECQDLSTVASSVHSLLLTNLSIKITSRWPSEQRVRTCSVDQPAGTERFLRWSEL